MTDQEKNEVLAGFAGFSRGVASGWLAPAVEGKAWGPVALPDFMHSLDALNKWCFQKVRDEFGEEGWARVFKALSDSFLSLNPFGKKMAEACAEAILSLIGEDDG